MICKATTVYVIANNYCIICNTLLRQYTIKAKVLLSHTATRRKYYLHKYKRKVLSSVVLCEKLLLLNISSLINISYNTIKFIVAHVTQGYSIRLVRKKYIFCLFYAKKHIIFTYTE